MNDKNHVHLSVAGATAADVVAQLLDLAKTMGSDPITSTKTEDLLAELRDRLAKNGQVVKVVPFADEENSTAPATRTRKPRGGDKQPATPEPETGDASAEQTEGATQTTTATVEKPKDTVTDAAPAAKTLDDVKKALNDFSAVKGQVAARSIMQEVGGAMRLMDIAADKYGALVAKLDEERVKPATTETKTAA